MTDDNIQNSNIIEFFEQFVQYAVLKEVKEQSYEKISNEWSYFKALLGNIASDPQRISIYLDILKKTKENTVNNLQSNANITSVTTISPSSSNQLEKNPSALPKPDAILTQSNNISTQNCVFGIRKSDSLECKTQKEQQDKQQGSLPINQGKILTAQQQLNQISDNSVTNQLEINNSNSQNSLSLGFQNTTSNNYIKSDQLLKKRESNEINPTQTINQNSISSSNPPIMKPSRDSSSLLQQQNSVPYLNKVPSSNSNISSVNSVDQLTSQLQSHEQDQQQVGQKSANLTPLKIEPKSLFEDSKSKFKFQRDKIKSKVKSILNLFKENNIFLNTIDILNYKINSKDEINDNCENIDISGINLNCQKINGTTITQISKRSSINENNNKINASPISSNNLQSEALGNNYQIQNTNYQNGDQQKNIYGNNQMSSKQDQTNQQNNSPPTNSSLGLFRSSSTNNHFNLSGQAIQQQTTPSNGISYSTSVNTIQNYNQTSEYINQLPNSINSSNYPNNSNQALRTNLTYSNNINNEINTNVNINKNNNLMSPNFNYTQQQSQQPSQSPNQTIGITNQNKRNVFTQQININSQQPQNQMFTNN